MGCYNLSPFRRKEEGVCNGIGRSMLRPYGTRNAYRRKAGITPDVSKNAGDVSKNVPSGHIRNYVADRWLM